MFECKQLITADYCLNVKLITVVFFLNVIKFIKFLPMNDIELYKNFIDKKVIARWQDGTLMKGICRSIDGYLNIVLENVEYADEKESSTINLSNCFVKGSFLTHIELNT